MLEYSFCIFKDFVEDSAVIHQQRPGKRRAGNSMVELSQKFGIHAINQHMHGTDTEVTDEVNRGEGATPTQDEFIDIGI